MSRKQIFIVVLIAFFIGSLGSIVIGRFLIPYLGNVKGWGFLNKFATTSPIVINHTQEIQLNEGVNLIDLIKNSGNVTVSIFGPTNNFLGNGVIMTSDGLIFASSAVIGNQSSLTVTTFDGKKYPVTIKDRDKNGLVALTIVAQGLQSVQLDDAASLQSGQRVMYLGRSNAAFEHEAMAAFVTQSSKNQLENIQVSTDANFNPDYFGGPIMNLSGHVVGLVINNTENIIAENLKTALNKYLTTGKIQ